MICDFDLLSVDFQGDFAREEGVNFNKGHSINFVEKTLFPFLRKQNIKVAEIVSDYRLPRGKSKNESCVPGTKGFESLIPQDLKKGSPWIKCMHNPTWIREGIGIANAIPGNLYQDPDSFNQWILKNITRRKVVLFGLTADCCILQTASELYFRGYEVFVIYEATDPMNERLAFKDEIMYHSTLSIYAKTIRFNEFENMCGGK